MKNIFDELNKMPHEHIPLAQSPSGEIGPLCHSCASRLTFGEAMPMNQNYYCWTCYVEITGNGGAVTPDDSTQPFYRNS